MAIRTEEKKAELALRESQRREKDRVWLASLSEGDRSKVKADRAAIEKTRRDAHKATLSEEEVATRKAVSAAKSAARWQAKKEVEGPKPRLCMKGLHNLDEVGVGDGGRCIPCREAYKVRPEAEAKKAEYIAAEKARFEALPEAEKLAVLTARKEYDRKYYQAKQVKIKARKKDYHKENRHKILAEKKIYAKENPEVLRRNSRAMSSRRRAAFSELSSQDMEDIKAASNGYCDFCLNLIEGSIEIEHCVPLSRGGGNTFDNCVASCEDCNRGPGGKHAQTPLEFLVNWPKVTKKYDLYKENRAESLNETYSSSPG